MPKPSLPNIKSLSRREAGVALFISLVLLLVLTIAGVSAVQNTTLEERMARNSHDSIIAFQSAEAALRDAETFLEGIVNTAAFNNTGVGGLWTPAPYGQDPRWADETIWNGGSTVSAGAGIGGVAEQPRYMIEHVATVERSENPHLVQQSSAAILDRIEIFRITARGVGGSAEAEIILQSTFGVIF